MCEGHMQDDVQLVIESPDPFERLAVHGLAAYYRLQSHSALTGSSKAVRILRATAAQPSAQSTTSDTTTSDASAAAVGGVATAAGIAASLRVAAAISADFALTAAPVASVVDGDSLPVSAADETGFEEVTVEAATEEVADGACSAEATCSSDMDSVMVRVYGAESAVGAGAALPAVVLDDRMGGDSASDEDGFVPVMHPGDASGMHADARAVDRLTGANSSGVHVNGDDWVRAAEPGDGEGRRLLPFRFVDVVLALREAGAKAQPAAAKRRVSLTAALLETHWREHVLPGYVYV